MAHRPHCRDAPKYILQESSDEEWVFRRRYLFVFPRKVYCYLVVAVVVVVYHYLGPVHFGLAEIVCRFVENTQ